MGNMRLEKAQNQIGLIFVMVRFKLQRKREIKILILNKFHFLSHHLHNQHSHFSLYPPCNSIIVILLESRPLVFQ